MLETLIVLILVGLDQLSKHLVDIHLPLGASIPIWENMFHLTSVHNTGAAFGMFSGARWVFLVITPIALLALLWFMRKNRSKMHMLMRVCLAMLLAGAIGNFIDRALLGYVRDMFEFRFVQFAVFNVADASISIGAVLLAFDILFGKGKKFFEDDPGKKKNEVKEPSIYEGEGAASTPQSTPSEE